MYLFLDNEKIMRNFRSLSKEKFLESYSYISEKEYDFTAQMDRCRIVECPECEDRDCSYNIEGKCHRINTILSEVPSGMYTCDGAAIEFKREPKEGELW